MPYRSPSTPHVIVTTRPGYLIDVADHLVNRLILGLEAQGLHGSLELLGVNGSRSVRVEQVKRLSNLFDLLLRQPGTFVRLRYSLRGSSAGLAVTRANSVAFPDEVARSRTLRRVDFRVVDTVAE